MKVLYGVNGEGMGHATRSEVVIGALLDRARGARDGVGCRVPLPRAAGSASVNEIFGPSFAMEQGEIRRWATVTHTMTAARRELPGSVRRWMAAVNEWRPEVVVTDFEPLSGRSTRARPRMPLVCVDNIHMIDRCRHDAAIVDGAREDFRIARAVTQAMVPTAGDYVDHHVLPAAAAARADRRSCRRSCAPRSSTPSRCAASTWSSTPTAATR